MLNTSTITGMSLYHLMSFIVKCFLKGNSLLFMKTAPMTLTYGGIMAFFYIVQTRLRLS